MKIEFTLNTIPPTSTNQGVVRFGRGRVFKTGRNIDDLNVLASLLAPHVPKSPLQGRIFLQIELTFPLTAAAQKRKSWRVEDSFHTVRPDLDNWAKGFIDLLVKLRFFDDDASVCRLDIGKCRGKDPNISVFIINGDDEDLASQCGAKRR